MTKILLVLGFLCTHLMLMWKKAQEENRIAGRAYITDYVNKYAKNYANTNHARLFTEETRKRLKL